MCTKEHETPIQCTIINHETLFTSINTSTHVNFTFRTGNTSSCILRYYKQYMRSARLRSTQQNRYEQIPLHRFYQLLGNTVPTMIQDLI